MRLQTVLNVGGAFLLTAGLAACGGSGGSSNSSSGNSSSASIESQFGSEFAMIFDASSTSQPATPDSNAVPALQPAATPIAISAAS